MLVTLSLKLDLFTLYFQLAFVKCVYFLIWGNWYLHFRPDMCQISLLSTNYLNCFSTTGGGPMVRSFSRRRNCPPRSPHLVQVIHTTCRQLLIGHGFLTVNSSRMTVLQTLATEKQPPLTLTHLW